MMHEEEPGGAFRIFDVLLRRKWWGAAAFVIAFSAGTNYRSYDDLSGNPDDIAQSFLTKAKRKGFETLRKAHIADHQKLFRRVSLDLGPAKTERTTDARIKAFGAGDDPGLAALYFQYGR